MITKEIIKYVQRRLIALGQEPGAVDGDFDSETLAALHQITDIPSAYSKRRKLVVFIQLQARAENIETGAVDGYWGPQTEYAYEQLTTIVIQGRPELPWRPEELQEINPNNCPSQRKDEELIEYYGDPGGNQVMLELPFPHRLSWKTSTEVGRMQCHKKVHDSIGRVLQAVLNRGVQLFPVIERSLSLTSVDGVSEPTNSRVELRLNCSGQWDMAFAAVRMLN